MKGGLKEEAALHGAEGSDDSECSFSSPNGSWA